MAGWLALLALLLSSCQENEPRPASLGGTAMEMEWRLLVAGPLTAAQKREVRELIEVAFEEVDQCYNCFNPDSELSYLNQLQGGEMTLLSMELAALLYQADLVFGLTEGRFDPTVAPLCQLWKKEAPTQEQLDAIGWEHIHFGPGWFLKEKSLTALDLCGIAKGYGIDLIVERLAAKGYQDLYFEWGGEMRAIGHHPAGRCWQVAIAGIGLELPAATVELDNCAIATSGNYLQQWQREGRTYTHIIDPKALRPLEVRPGAIASATVLAKSCAFADALATAALLFETKEEAELWAKCLQEQFPELRFWFISR